jgi:VWFA-related protein
MRLDPSCRSTVFLVPVAVLALAASTSPQVPPSSPAPGAPQFPAGVELVSVDVVVLDKDGQPVPGLTAADFTVREDGAPQSIASFEAVRFDESAPSAAVPGVVSSNVEERVRPDRSFTIVYDDVHLTAIGSKLAQAEVGKLVDTMAAGDVMTIVPTSGAPWWTSRMPGGRDDLKAYLASLKPQKVKDQGAGRLADWEAMQIHYRRDPQVLAVVARRWYENGLIAETTPKDASIARDRDVDPGLALIRAKATEQYNRAAQLAVASLDVVERVAGALAAGRGRKTVLVVSEGFLYDSTRREYRDLVRAAREANAVLYFFDARGTLGADPPANEAEFGRPIQDEDRLSIVRNFSHDAEGSESVALDTGGRAFKGTDNLADGMEKVVRESRTYYLLGFASSNTKRDGKFRKLEVKVSRPGVDVRARPGYYAAGDDDKKRKADPKALDPRVRAGLDSPLLSDGIPMRMTSYVLGSGASGSSTALLVADVDLRAVAFESKGDRRVGALDTYVVVTPRDGGDVKRVEKRLDLALPPELLGRLQKEGLPLLRDFELSPGTYQARLLVRDARGSALGSVRHTFTVPRADGLRTSTPILTDAVQSDGGRELPVPLARRHFASGSRLFYVFDVYGAAPSPGGPGEVRIGYVVRRGDATFAESAPRAVVAAADGSISQKLVLPLNGAPPGQYEIRLTVTDAKSGTSFERRDAFLVDPS